jgi:branched-chain amino acid transport system permease protein
LVAISARASGLPLPVAALVAVVTVAVVAVVMERLTIAPVKAMTTLVSLILTSVSRLRSRR